MKTAARTALGTAAAILALLAAVVAALAALTGGTASGTPTGAMLLPSPDALADIPTRLLTLYQQAAATCPGLPWTVLAAIGKVETDHARNPRMVSTAGALGPMQFEPATFAQYATPVPPGGADPPTPWDPVDAIYAAARLLCANGARDGRNLPGAIYAYNHDPAYVTNVLRYARRYTSAADTAGAAGAAAPSPAAATAISYARTQLGVPYTWGGTTPGVAWDCSGLTQAAYAAAGISLPRTAQEQYDRGPRVPASAPLLPGDLIFYGPDDHHIEHVGLYLQGGRLLHAPHPGATVQIEPAAGAGTYQGATRPTSYQQPNPALRERPHP